MRGNNSPRPPLHLERGKKPRALAVEPLGFFLRQNGAPPPIVSLMAQQRPIGWLFEVKGSGDGVLFGRFGVLANTLQRAKVLVGLHVALTSRRVTFERILTEEEISRLRLKIEEVRECPLRTNSTLGHRMRDTSVAFARQRDETAEDYPKP